ncbi:pyridoxamine 5'-phosphate oxidase family protein [Candidatus Nitrosotenuis chungbukensis]|uniref:pyridoxamine 5'-phosphate oxidase family protein n=1 Tax=Candidatus Nitrosotenuis chungbukensis TaxID=1353246 RepID=UPI0005B2C80B|nr:pyridoxamine 5'-phosphate oxidase family protein [Candidatus Nitrosotenuis chungbukensis]WKT58671.1 pyridoxamine 5'-phosphate oxidase family protein [Candidatus Nitrosotenuis chungbukensis]
MNQIDDEIVHLIAKEGNVVVVATIDALGVPNISPRYVMAVLGEKIVFADAYRNKTFTNIRRWPKVTVAVVDRVNRGGFQLKGDAEEITDPELISECTKKLKELKFDSGPVSVWALIVKEIYSIKPSESSKLPLFSVYS